MHRLSKRKFSCVNLPFDVLSSVYPVLGDEDKKTIREAADVIAKHTCIRFVERTDQADYIEFYEDAK